jgi:hypothetical protein
MACAIRDKVQKIMLSDNLWVMGPRRRLFFVIAAVAVTMSCGARHARTERLMTWSEETHIAGMVLPRGQRIIVLRFVDDPGQGLVEGWNSTLQDRLTRLGNPVHVTFDCWLKFGGAFGFNIVAIGGQPYGPPVSRPAGAFSEGPSRPNPLESAVPTGGLLDRIHAF